MLYKKLNKINISEILLINVSVYILLIKLCVMHSEELCLLRHHKQILL